MNQLLQRKTKVTHCLVVRLGVMVAYELEGQYSSAQLTSDENNKHEDDQTCGGNAGNLTEEHPTLPRRSTRQKRALLPCHICDHEIRGERSENWEENQYSPNAF